MQKNMLVVDKKNLKSKSTLNTEVSFIDYLKAELVKRCKKNSRYSLRSFALSLGVTASFLSKLLSAKRPLTQKMFLKLSEKLNLSPNEIQHFVLNSKKVKSNPKLDFFSFNPIEADQFELISEWYYFAILELLTVKNFESNVYWISRQLNLSSHLASQAIDLLIRLGFVRLNENGQLKSVRGHHTTMGAGVSSGAAHRKQQIQLLEKAIVAISDVPVEKRSQSSVTLAIAQKDKQKAFHLISQFRREFTQLMQDKTEFDSVFQLVISFYPLTVTQ